MRHDRRLTCLAKLTSLTGDAYDGSETNEGNIMAFEEASDLFSFSNMDTVNKCIHSIVISEGDQTLSMHIH